MNRNIVVIDWPTEWGTQQKVSFRKISNPEETKGRAYSSSVGWKYESFSFVIRSRNRLRKVGNLSFMSQALRRRTADLFVGRIAERFFVELRIRPDPGTVPPRHDGSSLRHCLRSVFASIPVGDFSLGRSKPKTSAPDAAFLAFAALTRNEALTV